MKILGYFLSLLSIGWLFTVGLHALAHLMQPLCRVPHALRWFWHLPLPVSVMNVWNIWPMLIGLVGTIAGKALIERTKRSEKKRQQESEA